MTELNVYQIGNHMALDKSTIKNLEITETIYEHTVKGSLLGVLDKTHTAMGSRKMKTWLREPLNTAGEIKERLDAVEDLVMNYMTRNNLRESLKAIYDFERLAARISWQQNKAMRPFIEYLRQLIRCQRKEYTRIISSAW